MSPSLRAALILGVAAVPATSPAQCPNGAIGVGSCAPRLAPDSNVIAILPFTVTGAAGSEHLGEMVMDLLQFSLDGRANIRVLYPAQVLRRVGPGGAADPVAATRVTRDMGAGRLVGGQLVVSGSEVRIRADIYDAQRGTRQFVVDGRGDAKSLAPAIDTLASRILANRLVPVAIRAQRGVTDYATPSTDALNALLIAEQAYRRGQYRTAADSLKAALRYDPDYGLAHARILKNEGASLGITGIPMAQLLRDARGRLSKFTPRVRAMIEVAIAHQTSDRRRAVSLADEIARQYPNDADALFLLADKHFHFGMNLGEPREAVVAHFVRALAADDASFELLQHAQTIFEEMGDSVRSAQIIELCRKLSSQCSSGERLHAAMAGRERPWASTEPQLTPTGNVDVLNLRFLTRDLGRGAAILDSFAIHRIALASTPAAGRATAYVNRFTLALLGGRHESAWQLLDSARAAGRLDAYPGWVRLYHLMTGLRRAEAEEANRAGSVTSEGPNQLSYRAYFESVAAVGDSGRAAMARLSMAPFPDSLLGGSIVTGLEGLRRLRAGDSTRAREMLTAALSNHVRKLNALERIMWPASAFVYELARLEAARGNFTQAKVVLADLYPAYDVLPHLAQGEELKGQVYAALGDTASAKLALRNFIGLWDKADAPLQPRVAAARAALARLEGR